MKYFADKNFNLKIIRRSKFDDIEGQWTRLIKERNRDFDAEYFSILKDNISLIVSLID